MRPHRALAWFTLAASPLGCGVDSVDRPRGDLVIEVKLRDARGLSAIRAALHGTDGQKFVRDARVPEGSLTVQIGFYGIHHDRYALALSGQTAELFCKGGGDVEVHAASEARVIVPLSCKAPFGGKVPLAGDGDDCPFISAIFASPARVDVRTGEIVFVEAQALDPNGDAIEYSWSASSGTFSSATTPRAEYRCGALGPVRLTVSALSDPSCGDAESVDIECSDGRICGDGFVGEAEECDPPDGAVCSARCRTIDEQCGNGTLQGNERCDPPDQRTCSDECQPIVCGDALQQGAEECDPPDGVNCTLHCKSIPMNCGDGAVQSGEQCDPPRTETCNDRCRTIICGDGVAEGMEDCDPPDGISCDGFCRRIATCGDGEVQADEQCDPPRFGRCDSLCRSVACGDGSISEGENCDPPNDVTCDSFCRAIPITCGDSIVQPGEECDPPDGNSCNSGCRHIVCGDGRKEGFESCDPPDGSACSTLCQTIVLECGNGVVQSGEECDPPDGALCSRRCTHVRCGDGVREGREECDSPHSSYCDQNCRRTSENRCPGFGWLGAWPLRVAIGETIFTHALASDPDQDALSYSWLLDPGGEEFGAGPSSSYVCTTAGLFGIKVRAVDDHDCAIEETIAIECKVAQIP